MRRRSLHVQCILQENLYNRRDGLPPQKPHSYEDSHRMGNSPARTVGLNFRSWRSHCSVYVTETKTLMETCLIFWQEIIAKFWWREKTRALLLQTRSGLIGKFFSGHLNDLNQLQTKALHGYLNRLPIYLQYLYTPRTAHVSMVYFIEMRGDDETKFGWVQTVPSLLTYVITVFYGSHRAFGYNRRNIAGSGLE